jgi:beta-lactamase superfamily II metal-dependent hydrolase
VILLIDVGDKRLLFPATAQIENWSWALKHAPKSALLCKLLSRVDLYKVGHHGSRNATPRFALSALGRPSWGRVARWPR